jgi:hypothetical protein
MCFSATASFGASAGLAGLGLWSLRLAPSRAHRAVGAIPLLFAAQQASEGFVWLSIGRSEWGVTQSPLATMFLFFALFVWPAYLPVAFRAIEPDERRRRVLAALAVLGTALGLYLMATVVFRPTGACLAWGNLYYGVKVDAPVKPISPLVYLAVVIAPLAVSSIKGTNVLALATAGSFAAAAAMNRAGFASIWCFLAAVLSGIVVVIVHVARRAPSSLGAERVRGSER